MANFMKKLKFKLTLSSHRKVLNKHFPHKDIEVWIKEITEIYDEVLDALPYIGGKDNKMTKYLTNSSVLIPIAKILKREGFTIRKIGHIIYEITEQIYNKIPKLFYTLSRKNMFKEKSFKSWKNQAERSKMSEYPYDWKFDFIEGEGKEFDYGLDMYVCGLKKFWKSQNLEELVPYLCLTDYISFKLTKVKVKRTQTLANGGECCDYRYYKEGIEFKDGWPPESVEEWTGKFEN